MCVYGGGGAACAGACVNVRFRSRSANPLGFQAGNVVGWVGCDVGGG